MARLERCVPLVQRYLKMINGALISNSIIVKTSGDIVRGPTVHKEYILTIRCLTFSQTVAWRV